MLSEKVAAFMALFVREIPAPFPPGHNRVSPASFDQHVFVYIQRLTYSIYFLVKFSHAWAIRCSCSLHGRKARPCGSQTFRQPHGFRVIHSFMIYTPIRYLKASIASTISSQYR